MEEDANCTFASDVSADKVEEFGVVGGSGIRCCPVLKVRDATLVVRKRIIEIRSGDRRKGKVMI